MFSRAVLQEEDLTNPILERIMNQYQEIAAALRQALPQIFRKRIYRKRKLPTWCFILPIL